jgi:hypothetical protein
MAFVYFTEFSGLGITVAAGHGAQPAQAPLTPAVAESRLAIGSTQELSAAFNANTRLVLVHTDANCHIAISSNPTASSTKGRMGAGESRFYAVRAGIDKLAVITTT